MPTKPLEAILFRDLSKAEAKEDIETASQVLQELVNFATNALARCSTSTSLTRKENEDVAVLALYRHIIELTDGIEVLLSQSCAMAAIPVLRSSFEALLAIEYLLENESYYVQRSLAWIVSYTHKRINMYDRLDSSTQKGQEAKKLFDRDKVMTASTMKFAPISDIQKAKANLQAVLTKPNIQPIEIEYLEQIKSKKNNNIQWYSLFGGPGKFRDLAQQLQRGGFYEILYRQWSTSVHGEDFSSFLDNTNKGNPAIRRLRDPAQIRDIANFASVFLLEATRLIIKKLRPGEDLATWYKREIQKNFLRLSRKEPNTSRRRLTPTPKDSKM